MRRQNSKRQCVEAGFFAFRMSFFCRLLVWLWAFLFFPLSYADISFTVTRLPIEEKSHSGPFDTHLRIQGQRVRLGPLQEISGYLLFDGATKTISQVLPEQQAYREIDSSTFLQVEQALKQVQAKLLAELDQLPGEHRESMLETLHLNGAQTQAVDLAAETLKPTEEFLEVLERRCQVFEQRLPEAGSRKICLVAPEYFGLQPEKLEVVQQFYEYLISNVGGMPGGQHLVEQLSFWGYLLRQVPLDVRRYSGQSVRSVYQMRAVQTHALDPDLFVVPKGFRRIDDTF